MTTKTSDPERLVRDGFDALNDRSRDAFRATHTEDLVVHDHDRTVEGVEAVVETEWAVFEGFPDMALDVEDMVAEGDTVAVRWTATGTHEGAFEGIDPAGAEVSFSNSGFFRVDDGGISEVWLLADRLGMLGQLGVVDVPTDGAEA